MKYILSLIISGALVVSGFGQTRNVLVGTNNAVVQPTNFWSADAANARTGLGLGTAATNPATAFQPASTNLTLLANGDGSSLTNLNLSGLGTINISNVSGLQSALDGKLATNGSAANLISFPATILQTTSALTNFPAGLLRTNGDGSGLTNLPVPAVASNILSTIGLDKGGTAATNASGARINLGGTTIGINIFTATDAASARSFLGLGTAATSAASAFQPSSSVLTNLANNNASSLTNLTAANIVGTVALASNVSGTVAVASNVSGVVSLANGGTGGTNAATARSGLGLGTTNTLTIAGLVSDNLTINSGGGITLQAILTNAANFRTNIGLPWSGLTSADAPTFRTALGLGTAATNAATAFQASSATLSNLATANGGSLTNLQATSLVGTIPSSNIATVNFSNLAGTLSIASGGTGATNAANARQNLGSTTVGDAVFIATNAAAARTAIGALASNSDGSGLTNLTAANITGTVALASNLSSPLALTNGGTGATNAATARTNLGLGWSALTNANLADVLLGYNSSNNTIVATQRITFSLLGLGGGTAAVPSLTHSSGTNTFGAFASSALGIGAYLGFSANGVRNFYISTDSVGFDVPFNFFNTTNAAISRTNLGLPWSGLTNTNAETFQAALFPSGTNPVLVDTNGEVVSPTNFWQAAPIATTLQNSQPVANATNAATNARLLFLFSLAPSTTGVTNTITLPTNGSTFNGDVATITHNAPTSSVTAIRQLGATNNIITLNQPDETVRFLYRDNQWELMDNISYIEPIYFSGTNAAANAAASRTNLGLGVSDEVTFGGINSESYIRVVSGTNIFVDLADDQNEFTAPTTFQTNVTVNGFVNFSTNHTNVAPATNNQVQRWLQIRIGTNAYFLPLYQ